MAKRMWVGRVSLSGCPRAGKQPSRRELHTRRVAIIIAATAGAFRELDVGPWGALGLGQCSIYLLIMSSVSRHVAKFELGT